MTSVADLFKLVSQLLGSLGTYSSTMERSACLLRGKEPEVGPENIAVDQDGNHKTLADAQVQETREGHTRELDKLRNWSKVRESELLKERDKFVAEQS